jgi:isoleucyl-tRNA synthetase
VKEVVADKNLGEKVELDTTITPELKAEGQARDFIRLVQELRKKIKLNPSDVVALTVSTDAAGKKLIEHFEKEISKTAQLSAIHFKKTEGEELKVDDLNFVVTIEK